MNDFSQDSEALVQAQLKATERVIRSGWWVLGNEVSSFEQEWASFIGTHQAIGVANGMDALEIGLRSLDIGKGDEVITTAMTAFATVLAILRTGATPVLADINPLTGILDIDSVERCITPQTRAVMIVHLYGQAAPMDVFTELCSNNDIYLIEDSAQAHGAKFNGQSIGSFGEFSGWSFYPTKNLGALGDAGAITTNSTEFANKAKILRNYGQSVRYYHSHIGMNSRLDELQAAILRERIKYLPTWTERRCHIAHTYSKEIQNSIITALPLPDERERHVHHLFVIKSERREKLHAFLQEKGVQSLIHYPVPIHHQQPTCDLKIDPKGLSATEEHAQKALSIPCHPALDDNSVAQVIDVINNYK